MQPIFNFNEALDFPGAFNGAESYPERAISGNSRPALTAQRSISPRQIDRLLEITRALNAAPDPQVLPQLLTTAVVEILDCEAAFLWLDSGQAEPLVCAASAGAAIQPSMTRDGQLPNLLAGEVYRCRQPLWVSEILPIKSRGWPAQDNLITHSHTWLGAPLVSHRRAIGALEAAHKCGGDFERTDLYLLSTIASQAVQALDNVRMEKELHQALSELERLEAFNQNFLALASHELRSPLSIIFGYANFLADTGQGQTSEHASMMLKAAQRLRSLVEEFTDMNLLKQGLVDLQSGHFDLIDILRRAFQEVQQAVEAKGQQFIFDYPPQDLHVQADAELLSRAFASLFDNAIRFTPPQAHIQVHVSVSDDDILVAISDPGAGIGQQALEHIFEEYFQEEHILTRRVNGIGLGLPIARSILALHGGHIWAESAGVGEGATFYVSLPKITGRYTYSAPLARAHSSNISSTVSR
jgi:signal transduction histidine kinase